MEDKVRNIISKIVTEVLQEEEELEEATTTADIEGYNTPFAFGGEDKSSKKKKKEISTNSTGYKMVKESIDDKDIKYIKSLIRDTVANILRDIWLKRSAWKKGTK